MYLWTSVLLLLLTVAETSVVIRRQDVSKKGQPAIEVIATLVPWADKEERLLSLFHSVAVYARKYEPNTTRYAVYTHPYTPASNGSASAGPRPKGATINVLERYTTQEAFDKHIQSPPYIKLTKAFAEEGLLSVSPGALNESWVRFVDGYGE